MGGKGPQVVFADADIEAATDGIAYGVYHNAGQCCISGSRLIVHGDIRDDLLARMLEISRKVPFGDPLNDTTRIGAMISRAHLDKVESYVRAGVVAGAELLIGGAPEDQDGLFYQPTIFDGVTTDMSIMREEIFGPVLSATTFTSIEQAVALEMIWNSVCQPVCGRRCPRDADRRLQEKRDWQRIGTLRI